MRHTRRGRLLSVGRLLGSKRKREELYLGIGLNKPVRAAALLDCNSQLELLSYEAELDPAVD